MNVRSRDGLVKNGTIIKKYLSSTSAQSVPFSSFKMFQNFPLCRPFTGIISLKYFSNRNIEDDHSIKTDLNFSYFRQRLNFGVPDYHIEDPERDRQASVRKGKACWRAWGDGG